MFHAGMNILLTILNLLIYISAFAVAENVILETSQGILKGVIEQSRAGRPFYSFYGIPYAQPPLGELRFEDPAPPKPWQGVRDASILPPPCIALFQGQVEGDEDCLYLNLYTPKLNGEEPMPVIVFIYGGGYMLGHALPSRYGPHYFMDRDVILITFHYRLGTLGFLSTEDSVLPGNYGLKDFVAVLKWVQQYVGHFNGDRNRVTVMGGSSGGMTASLALISPLTTGLFHGCIAHSGSRLDLYYMKRGIPRKIAWKIASSVGCAGEDVTSSLDLVTCLRKLPVNDLVGAHFSLFKISNLLPILYAPVIEDESIPGAFLVDEPKKLFARNSDIPLLLGINADEGGMAAIFIYYSSTNTSLSNELARNYKELLPQFLSIDNSVKDPIKLEEAADKSKQYFFGESDIRTNAQGFSRMFAVSQIIPWVKETLQLYRGPKYAYYYAHKNEQSFAQMYGNPPEDMGVIHGDELISMFNWSEVITPVTKGIDLVVSEQVLDLWTNFAASGNPNPSGEKGIWKPVESSKPSYLYIKDGTFSMKDEHDLFEKDAEFLEYLSSLYSDQ